MAALVEGKQGDLLAALAASTDETTVVAALQALALGVAAGEVDADKKAVASASNIVRKSSPEIWTGAVKTAFNLVLKAYKDKDEGRNKAVRLRICNSLAHASFSRAHPRTLCTHTHSSHRHSAHTLHTLCTHTHTHSSHLTNPLPNTCLPCSN